MTASDLKRRLLRVVSVENPSTAPAHVVDAVLNAINHAYQVLWLDVPKVRREEYTRAVREFVVEAGTGEVDLPADVQGVLPPVRILADKRPLFPAAHRSEVENYARLVPYGSPMAIYWLEATHRNAPEGARLRLIFAPAPAEEVEIVADIEVRAPRLEASDLCADPGPHLRIPNAYAEGVLLPVAAYHLAVQSHWHNKPERLDSLRRAYEESLARVGVSSPSATAPRETVQPSDR